jgi:hypothetical protein
LFQGAKCCALEAHLLLFNWYCKHAVQQQAFEALLKVLQLILPGNNELAGSLYLIRKVRGVPCFQSCEHNSSHSCTSMAIDAGVQSLAYKRTSTTAAAAACTRMASDAGVQFARLPSCLC